jgi:hypothetical protein
MDDLLKPNDQSLIALATELGLMSILPADAGNAEQKPEQKTVQLQQKVAQLT